MKSKLSWIPFIPLTLLAFFFKLAQKLLPEGALFGLSPLRLEYLSLGCVALIFIFALIFCLTDRKSAAYYMPRRNIPAGVLGIITAVLLAADGANTLFRAFSAGQIDTLSIVCAVLALLSAIVFVVLGLNHIFRFKDTRQYSLLYALPALWFGVRMILSFVSFTTISIRLADVSGLICCMLAAMFFFNYAVMLSLIKTKSAVKNCFIYGLPAVAAMLPYSVYRLVFAFDSETILNNIFPLEMLFFSLYILMFLIELTAHISDKDSITFVSDEPVKTDVPSEKLQDFIASNRPEDDGDQDDAFAYLRSGDTEDFLYQEVPQDDSDYAAADTAREEEVSSYLTEEYDDSGDEDDRPADYESNLDEIDKLILEINRQSD